MRKFLRTGSTVSLLAMLVTVGWMFIDVDNPNTYARLAFLVTTGLWVALGVSLRFVSRAQRRRDEMQEHDG